MSTVIGSECRACLRLCPHHQFARISHSIRWSYQHSNRREHAHTTSVQNPTNRVLLCALRWMRCTCAMAATSERIVMRRSEVLAQHIFKWNMNLCECINTKITCFQTSSSASNQTKPARVLLEWKHMHMCVFAYFYVHRKIATLKCRVVQRAPTYWLSLDHFVLCRGSSAVLAVSSAYRFLCVWGCTFCVPNPSDLAKQLSGWTDDNGRLTDGRTDGNGSRNTSQVGLSPKSCAIAGFFVFNLF